MFEPVDDKEMSDAAFEDVLVSLRKAYEDGAPFLAIWETEAIDGDTSVSSMACNDPGDILELCTSALRVAYVTAVETGDDLPDLPDFITDLGGDYDSQHGPN